MKICMRPSPEECFNKPGGVASVVSDYGVGLGRCGVEFVGEDEADLVIVHAMTNAKMQPDVTHTHGIYPTGDGKQWKKLYYDANRGVIDNANMAITTTCMSTWTAEILRRIFNMTPTVIRNGIWIDKYTKAGKPKGAIIWAKTRTDDVCDPNALLRMATAMPGKQFVSIAPLAGPPNLKSTGTMPRNEFIQLLSGCSIYLGTTKENSSMGTMEAMALGIPVVGFDHGFNADMLTNNVGCKLVEPGNYRALYFAIQEVLMDWIGYSADARAYAQYTFDWAKVFGDLIQLYEYTIKIKSEPDKVSIVIPSHNYGMYIFQAVQSALDQGTEVIVVDDASTDNSVGEVRQFGSKVKLIELKENGGVAHARNLGIENAIGNLIVCLDADDYLHPGYVSTLLPAFVDRSIGIAYSPTTPFMGEKKYPPWFTQNFDMQMQLTGHNQIPSCCMFRKSWWERAGGFRQEYAPAEDAELWLRMAILGAKVKRMGNKPTMAYRMHPNSASARGFGDWFSDKKKMYTNTIEIKEESDDILPTTSTLFHGSDLWT